MFIAEVGINHNGSLETAKELIKMAHDAGADVVKFQKRNPDVCVPQDQKDAMKDTPWGRMKYIDYRKRMEFSMGQYMEINLYCKQLGIQWSASVWDMDSLRFIDTFDVPFIKIPSACINNIPLLERAKQTGKPIIISTGMSNEREVDMAVTTLMGCDLTVMHCNSNYPSRYDELDLSNISYMKQKYASAKIGYSGHEEGIMPSVVALALGAEVIERHITLNKNMWGSDQRASLEYEELRQLVDAMYKMDAWMGDFGIRCYPSEEAVKKKLRKE